MWDIWVQSSFGWCALLFIVLLAMRYTLEDILELSAARNAAVSGTTAARTCTASAALSVNNVGAYTWTSAGLAADVQSWLDGSDGNWILVSDEQTTFSVRAFASRSNFSENARPVLTIAYTEAIPESATVVMLLAGLALLLGLNRKRLA